MDTLVDTGVLLRWFDTDDPEHPAIRDGLRRLRQNGDHLFVTAQNVAEFWNVSTRPASARGGYGLSPQVTARRVEFIERQTAVLTETRHSYRFWSRLVTSYSVRGVAVHDARIVSIMLAHRIRRIATLNGRDFVRYSEVAVASPADI